VNRTIPVINFILIVTIIIEGLMIVRLWSSEAVDVAYIKNRPSKVIKLDNIPVYEKKVTPLSAYVDIVKYNLFSSKREAFIKELPEPEPESEVAPEIKKDDRVEKLTTDKIILYGVIIMDDYRKALVSVSDKKNQLESIWIEKDEVLDNFIVDTIERDRIIVSANNKRYSVLLYNVEKPKKRNYSKQKPVKKKISAQPPKKVKPVTRVKPIIPESKQDSKKKISDGEYEIISTPFGDFKRKKKK